MLILDCETASAGLADPRRRTNWQAWDGSQLQEPDFNWRLRVDIATRSLECLVQIDPDGYPVLQSCDQPSTIADAMGFAPRNDALSVTTVRSAAARLAAAAAGKV
jgi:hypothetical protein